MIQPLAATLSVWFAVLAFVRLVWAADEAAVLQVRGFG